MPETMNIETVRALAKKLRNWGRWGATDELGTVNFITPAKIKAAASLVRQGKVLSLAIPFDANGPQTGFGGRINPLHYMLQDGGDIASGAQDFLPALCATATTRSACRSSARPSGTRSRTSTSTARCTTTAAPSR